MEGLLVTVKKTVRRRAPRLVGLAGAVVLGKKFALTTLLSIITLPIFGVLATAWS